MLETDDMHEPGNDTWLWITIFGAGVVVGMVLIYLSGYL